MGFATRHVALLLPLFFFLLLIPWVRRWQTRGSLQAGGWEGTVLIAAALWGAFLALGMEALSLAGAIRTQIILLGWLLADLALLGMFLFGLRQNPLRSLHLARPQLAAREWFLVGTLGALLAGLLAVAWTAPVNNSDSLLYHMARVVHWAQNGSLQPYGTAYGHQLWSPPWAEMAILNARLLWGDDRPANLVQWTAYIGTLIGVAGIARLLQLNRGLRWLAIAFAASLPMALLQATSTQVDLVVSFWFVAACALVLLLLRAEAGWLETVAIGAALGLGLLTKGTYYALGAPIGVWLVLSRPWRKQPRRSLAQVGVVVLVLVLLNAGYWSRNLIATGSPLGPPAWVEGMGGVGSLGALKSKIALYPVRVLRGLAQHFATPWPPVNASITSAIHRLYAWFGVEVHSEVLVWSWNHEDRAGNPLPVIGIALSLIAGLFTPRLVRQRLGPLMLVAAGGFVMLTLFTQHSLIPLGIRYHLPLFVVWAPIFAATLGTLIASRPRIVLSFALLLSGLPWLLFNATRPVIGMRPESGPLTIPCLADLGCTVVGSVFVEPPVRLAFANVPQMQDDLVGATQALANTACREVGLRIDSSDPEYLIWYLLQAPQSGYRLETIYTSPDLNPLLDREFKPCAVICTICGGRTRLHGLALSLEYGGVKLFVGDGFTWDEDG